MKKHATDIHRRRRGRATMVGFGPKAHAPSNGARGRYVPHADLRILDPIWTTQNIAATTAR